jgi:hypothetical protein
MTLADGVAGIFARPDMQGWKLLLAQHGLDLSARDLAAELARPLPSIDRTIPGFEDFCPDATRGIEAGVPSRSLLYHALASPLVHPPNQGGAVNPRAYPTLEDLDTVENYIYSLTKASSRTLPRGTVIAVFAYQYRTGVRSAHGMFADMCFSRTGVSRVGTVPENFDPIRRCFWVDSHGGTGTAVMPARFAAFLAAPVPTGVTGVVQDKLPDDKGRTFLFPFHKLFAGPECLTDVQNLSVSFSEFHRNEKPARVHTHGHIAPIPGFDLTRPPFVRDSVNAPGELVTLRRAGASALIVPTEGPLVRTATQRNSQTGRDEITRFVVPPGTEQTNQRFWTSLQIELGRVVGRMAPEYVNIRHRVITDAKGTQIIEDLNAMPKNGASDPMIDLVNAGGYDAAHFVDGTCDGYVLASVTGLSQPSKPAYSLVTAPDFFPLVDQITISRWASRNFVNLQDQFGQGSPEALSTGRLPANPTLTLAGAPQARAAFDRGDHTMTAVLGVVKIGANTQQAAPNMGIRDGSTTFLPDAASDIFEPGWDISSARDSHGEFYASFGLGSPFTEDAKLCAALNSFWPAAAPDTTRTFGLHGRPYCTAIPMLDHELGYHPHHPLVLASLVASSRGWDGEFGPFFEQANGFVNYADRQRSDYVSNALAGLVQVSLFSRVSSDELIGRMEALRACIRKLPVTPHVVSHSDLLLVSAERVDDWRARPDRGDVRLEGAGLLYVFARMPTGQELPTPDVRRLRAPVASTYTCQVSVAGQRVRALCFQVDHNPFQFVLNP